MLEHITAEEIAQYGVVASPDRLVGKAQDNKATFDRLVRELVAVVVNRVIDEANALESAEEPRAAAESARVQAEALRLAAETARANAETDRAQAETARASAEGVRGERETARMEAETARVNAEAARVAAEVLRGMAEEARAAAEAARNVWEGYDPNKPYAPGNKTVYLGSSYLCLNPTTGHAPTDPAFWRVIAEKGDKGEQGPIGPTGPKGETGPQGPAGAGTGDMLASVYDAGGLKRDVFGYAAEAADEAVEAHDKADAVHANMNFVTFREGAPVPPPPVNADLLEHKTKAEVSAEILAAMDASLASDKVKWDAKADLVAPVTVTVPLAGWTGTGPWVQTVPVAGVTAADEHIGISLAVPADRSTVDLIAKAYGCIVPPDGDAETVEGGVKLTCFKAKPEVAFQVVVKGVR